MISIQLPDGSQRQFDGPVTVELSQYDLTRGRIVYRFK